MCLDVLNSHTIFQWLLIITKTKRKDNLHTLVPTSKYFIYTYLKMQICKLVVAGFI